MPRSTDIRKKGYISIPKDMNRASWKVIIIDSNGTEYDVTDYLPSGQLNRIATVGLSNFSLTLDNTEARYKDKFSAGDSVNIYYNYKEKDELTTIRFRGYLDGVFDNISMESGFVLLLEGRDAPKSSYNEHFADTFVTLRFEGVNNLDCWFGTDGDTDSEGNLENGVLYKSGLILKVYDTLDSTWKNYTDLTLDQKETLKAQTGYTQTHANTYTDVTRLTISKELANEGNYDFRIYYDVSEEKSYLMVHPENVIVNTTEHITVGQNFISLNRYGKDTLEEFNRIKERGVSDGDILLMRTKEDTTRQSAIWIKDKVETTASLTKGDEVSAKATARLNELKESLNKGNLRVCGLPSLQPAEKVPLNIPYVVNDNIKVKSFVVDFGAEIGLEFGLDIQEREPRFERIIKDRIDETANISASDNPNGMRNSLVFDFSDSSDYLLEDCQINDGILSLEDGKTAGTCTILSTTVDENVTKGEIRIKGDNVWKCTYRVSNNGGTNLEDIELSPEFIEFTTVGKVVQIKINLVEERAGVSPNIDKVNFLYT